MKVGIMLPMGPRPDTGLPVGWKQLRGMAQQAEAGGLDSAWVIDHLIFHMEGQVRRGVDEAFVTWAALAEATKRIELGSMVICTAFRNPAVLAKMAVTLDEIAAGRLILGLGAGWHKPEFDAFGIDFNRLVDQFEETIQIIKPLVQEGTVDFTGTYWQAPDCEMLPRPKRPIPILIASTRDRMLRLTARYADAWNTAWYGEVSTMGTAWEKMLGACEAEQRDPSTLELTVGVRVRFDNSPEADVDRSQLLVGDVPYVADQIAAYAAAGVKHLIVGFNPYLTEETLEKLIEAVRLSRS